MRIGLAAIEAATFQLLAIVLVDEGSRKNASEGTSTERQWKQRAAESRKAKEKMDKKEEPR